MHKFPTLVVTSLLLGSGLVVAQSPASANHGYTGTFNTTCQSSALNNPRVGNPARVEFRVQTGGNGGAAGEVTFKYVRTSNDVVVDRFERSYDGPGYTDYRFNGIPRGRYRVEVYFESRPRHSVYEDCADSFSQQVRRR